MILGMLLILQMKESQFFRQRRARKDETKARKNEECQKKIKIHQDEEYKSNAEKLDIDYVAVSFVFYSESI